MRKFYGFAVTIALIMTAALAGCGGGGGNCGENPPNPTNGPVGSVGSPKIYVADTGNNRIVRMDDMTGAGWTTFGTEGHGTSQFYHPDAVSVDNDGRIYVAEYLNHRIVRMDDMTGAGWTARDANSMDVYVDSNSKIYVTDYDRFIYRMDDMTGAGDAVLVGTQGTRVDHFNKPIRVRVGKKR
ncbi:MAG TPA: hypothetical protein VHR47_00305 [Bacillota bacterium]|nr:hypothetical protein [Bacillota bacterium]